MIKICEHCGKEFNALCNSQRFCCKECVLLYRQIRIKLKCNYCGKEFERRPSEIKQVKGNKYYCCIDCKNKGQLQNNDIVIKENYAQILIKYKNEIIIGLIDIDDIEKVQKLKWKYNKKTNTLSSYERFNRQNRKRFLLHRYIMDCPDDMVIDHINHNRLDNRKCNLRICTQSENMQNRFIEDRNICWSKKSNGWQVSLKINNKSIQIGTYKNLEIARQKAKEAREKYFTHSLEYEEIKELQQM